MLAVPGVPPGNAAIPGGPGNAAIPGGPGSASIPAGIKKGIYMAITNHDRVGKALELLRDGLRPFVDRELEAKYGKYWITTVTSGWSRDVDWGANDEPHLDAAV